MLSLIITKKAGIDGHMDTATIQATKIGRVPKNLLEKGNMKTQHQWFPLFFSWPYISDKTPWKDPHESGADKPLERKEPKATVISCDFVSKSKHRSALLPTSLCMESSIQAFT